MWELMDNINEYYLTPVFHLLLKLLEHLSRSSSVRPLWLNAAHFRCGFCIHVAAFVPRRPGAAVEEGLEDPFQTQMWG